MCVNKRTVGSKNLRFRELRSDLDSRIRLREPRSDLGPRNQQDPDPTSKACSVLSILLETMELLSAVVHEADVTNPIIHAAGISKGAVRSNPPMNKM